MKIIGLMFSILLNSSISLACISNSVHLNDAAQLSALGIYDTSENRLTIDLDAIEKRLKQTGSAVINATDRKGKTTHKVVFLGSVKEESTENGKAKLEVIQSSFLVRDLSSGSEKTYLLKTNYLGNGVRSRSGGGLEREPKQDEEFTTLFRSNCL